MKALKCYSKSQVRTNVIFLSGENSWSHCQHASDSSFELIFPTTFVDFKLKLILACSLRMKEIKGKCVENCFGDQVSRDSTNPTGTSGQIECFNLHRALEMICTNLGMLSKKNC